jgi:hypothetical protein
MFGSRQTRAPLPVDQLALVREDLREALLASGERERPGLEAALRMIEEYSPEELRRRWATGILTAASVDPRADTVKAVKALRGAEPALSLSDAVALAKEAASWPAGSRPFGAGTAR